MLTKIVRVFGAVQIHARTPLNNGYERIQSLGFIQRKVVSLDLANDSEVRGIILDEFPARGEGDFCLDGDPSYADFVNKTFEHQNIVLTGSRRIPEYESGYFECHT